MNTPGETAVGGDAGEEITQLAPLAGPEGREDGVVVFAGDAADVSHQRLAGRREMGTRRRGAAVLRVVAITAGMLLIATAWTGVASAQDTDGGTSGGTTGTALGDVAGTSLGDVMGATPTAPPPTAPPRAAPPPTAPPRAAPWRATWRAPAWAA